MEDRESLAGVAFFALLSVQTVYFYADIEKYLFNVNKAGQVLLVYPDIQVLNIAANNVWLTDTRNQHFS